MVIDIELDEMKYSVKTEDDARSMALREVAKSAKGDSVTVAQILEKDNEIRKAYGLKEITKYPVFEMEYSPATGQSVWKKLLGAKIIRKPGQLPYSEAIYEDVENQDPARRMSEITPLVDKKIEEDFPGESFSKQERKPIERIARASVVKKMHLANGSDKDTPLPDYCDEQPEEVKEEKRKPGRPKNS